MFVCARGANGTITVPQAWTDRGEAPATDRLSAEVLDASRVLVDALMRRGEQAEGGAS
ncbi:hypothetical protein ACIOHS_39270 [Streptomyces sp. NPDC088253]|uniref:hypothetical protein n=1 Tax=Streptomyces sp. NPDC088253 TaxID=3365846 RepID=UPI0038219170